MSTPRSEADHSPGAYLELTTRCFPDWGPDALAWRAAQAFCADFPHSGDTVDELASEMAAARRE